MAEVRRNFTTITLVLIPVAIAINIAVGKLIRTPIIPSLLEIITVSVFGSNFSVMVGGIDGKAVGYRSVVCDELSSVSCR